MKNILTIIIIVFTLCSATCKDQKGGTCYKGKLEIKALCLNYTIKVLEGNIDTALLKNTWTDSHSGKTYTNVFGLANPCSFPEKLKQGEEFYFVIENEPKNDCAVCEAFYPTPDKKLGIKVVADCQ